MLQLTKPDKGFSKRFFKQRKARKDPKKFYGSDFDCETASFFP